MEGHVDQYDQDWNSIRGPITMAKAWPEPIPLIAETTAISKEK